MPFGHDVPDVVQPHGHQRHLRVFLRQVIKPCLEGPQAVIGGVACAFREKNQRIPLLQGLGHHGQRALALRYLRPLCAHLGPLDEQGIEHILSDETTQAGGHPEIGRGHRADLAALA
jgi:hypothetical protein